MTARIGADEGMLQQQKQSGGRWDPHRKGLVSALRLRDCAWLAGARNEPLGRD
jgi:hypothetical protein